MAIGASASAFTNSISIGYQSIARGSSTNSVVVGNSASAGDTSNLSLGNDVAIGYYANTSNGAFANASNVAIGAFANVYNSSNSVSHGTSVGDAAQVSSDRSIALGSRSKATQTNQFSVGQDDYIGTSSRHSWLRLANETVNATVTPLHTDFSDGNTQSLVLQQNSVNRFKIILVAKEAGGPATSTCCTWEASGSIWMANLTTTVAWMGTAPTFTAYGTVPSGWTVALALNTASGGFDINVKGPATVPVSWFASVELVELSW